MFDYSNNVRLENGILYWDYIQPFDYVFIWFYTEEDKIRRSIYLDESLGGSLEIREVIIKTIFNES